MGKDTFYRKFGTFSLCPLGPWVTSSVEDRTEVVGGAPVLETISSIKVKAVEEEERFKSKPNYQAQQVSTKGSYLLSTAIAFHFLYLYPWTLPCTMGALLHCVWPKFCIRLWQAVIATGMSCTWGCRGAGSWRFLLGSVLAGAAEFAPSLPFQTSFIQCHSCVSFYSDLICLCEACSRIHKSPLWSSNYKPWFS